RRVRLADTDGSGIADIVYLGTDGLHIYLNEAGNAWSDARVLAQFPVVDDHATVSTVDLLGRGTACVVWSSALPGDARSPVRYLDLMAGRKPHLLVAARNNLGAETVVEYASSTTFYLADKAAGHPWITRLPFPVHVVARVESLDRIARNRFVTRYSYHHGHYDATEREFRGFGRVERLDTEEFGVLGAAANVDMASHVPPALTKTWYHTGVYQAGQEVSRHLAQEYHTEPGLTGEQVRARLLDDTVLPAGLTAEEARQACRALKGSLLREEVYAHDGGVAADRPYRATERNYTIRRLQPAAANRFAVFLPHPREVVEYAYERQLYPVDSGQRADPRISHALTLAVDEYGSVLRSATVGYGRRFDDPDPRLATVDRQEQKRIRVRFALGTVTDVVDLPDAWRTPMPAESRAFELHNAAPAAGEPGRFFFTELDALIAQAGDGAHDLPYDDVTGAGASGGDAFRRPVAAQRVRYRRNDLTGELPPTQLESLALPSSSYRLAFTADLASAVYGAKLTPAQLDAALSAAGYVHADGDGGWWVPAQRVFYTPDATASAGQELAEAAGHFWLARRYVDPYGN
ncbi:MAG TPA: toxin TcdB middle/C-terminal domain-containing protein, partial [Micromonosporaceae bacterium]|nr:toxin TcdB middle/C-terminal domain-containing protein [Micromonosporaceae bacterium]